MKRQHIYTALLIGLFSISSLGLCNQATASPVLQSKQTEEKKTQEKKKPRRGKKEDLYGKKAKEVVSVFDSVISSAGASTVRIMNGKRQIAIGTVVDSDGLILTKASVN